MSRFSRLFVKNYYSHIFKNRSENRILFKLIATSTLTSYIFYTRKNIVYNQSLKTDNFSSSLKTLYSFEIIKHNSIENGVWVTYGDKVYDITEFIKLHPGGDIILKAAGGPLEPFWNIYNFHSIDNLGDILEPYFIGLLVDYNSELWKNKLENSKTIAKSILNNNVGNSRSDILHVVSNQPFNAETPLDKLIDNFLTPENLFYVRNHHQLPEIDLNEYNLTVCQEISHDDGHIHQELLCKQVDLDFLKKNVSTHYIQSTIQCSGNRRKEMSEKTNKKAPGLEWNQGAIGNASWLGYKVSDIFRIIEMKYEGFKHAKFGGLDGSNGKNYETSIPIEKALDNDTIIATHMNDEFLTLDHGKPLRLIVPGYTGARNVKWLDYVILSRDESQSIWQQVDYKVFPSNYDINDQIDFTKFSPIYEMPVSSVICSPLNESCINAKVFSNDAMVIPVSGYAYSGGGRDIVKVQLTIDGSNWYDATLMDNHSEPNRNWSWKFWKADIPIAIDDNLFEKPLVISCKAIDSDSNTQPETPHSIWNRRGLCNNSWHSVNFTIKKNNITE